MPTFEEQVVSQEEKHCLTVFVHGVGEDDFIEYFVALDAHENLVDIGPGYAAPEDLAALDDDVCVRVVRVEPSPLEGLGEVGLSTLPDFGLGARLALPVLAFASGVEGVFIVLGRPVVSGDHFGHFLLGCGAPGRGEVWRTRR